VLEEGLFKDAGINAETHAKMDNNDKILILV
jgi:hypothetical protein